MRTRVCFVLFFHQLFFFFNHTEWHAGSWFPSREKTCSLCSGRIVFQPLGHQGSPPPDRFNDTSLVSFLEPLGFGWRPGFDSWVGKIPWRRAWQPTPVFLPAESLGTEEPGRLQSLGSQRVRYD